MRTLLCLLAFVAFAGCDTADDGLRLDADFYVGSWTLASLSDDSGDRTADIAAVTDDLTFTFEADRDFQFLADFPDAVNQAGRDDVTVAGTYRAVAEVQTLTLIVSGVPPTFRAEASSASAVSITAPGAAVGLLLGQIGLDFDGDVTLGLRKR